MQATMNALSDIVNVLLEFPATKPAEWMMPQAALTYEQRIQSTVKVLESAMDRSAFKKLQADPRLMWRVLAAVQRVAISKSEAHAREMAGTAAAEAQFSWTTEMPALAESLWLLNANRVDPNCVPMFVGPENKAIV